MLGQALIGGQRQSVQFTAGLLGRLSLGLPEDGVWGCDWMEFLLHGDW